MSHTTSLRQGRISARAAARFVAAWACWALPALPLAAAPAWKSPVVNRDGELVGIIFDGNIFSLVLDIAYSEQKARAVSVASPAILEALSNIYGADHLVREIRGK